MKPKLTVTKDFVKGLNDLVDKLKNDKVLIGVPEEDASRSKAKGESEGINNATLLAINNYGSPANNIPPRPVLEIGIRRAADKVAEQFKKAATQSLEKGPQAATIYYERAGIVASTEVKKVINEQLDIQGPAESTLAARLARGFKGVKALIVTGQLRNSITYVIRGKT